MKRTTKICCTNSGSVVDSNKIYSQRSTEEIVSNVIYTPMNMSEQEGAQERENLRKRFG